MNTLVVLTAFDSAKNRMIAVYRLMQSVWIVLSLLFSFQAISKANAGEWKLVAFSDKVVNAMGIHPSDPQVLYAIAGDTLYKTVDGGDNWSALLFFPHSWGLICRECGIVIDPLSPDIIYVYADTMILKSVTSGSTWVNVSKGLLLQPEYNHSICYVTINPTNTNILYASTYSVMGGIFYIYLNDIWQEAPGGADIFVVIDVVSDTLMYAGMGGLFPGTVVKSTDGGWTWEPTEFPHDNFGIIDLCINPNLNQHLLVATTDSGMYRTMDGGLTWEQCNTGLTSLKLCISVAIDPDSSNIAYMGSYTDGVFISRDYGTTWESINDGLSNLSIHCLEVGPPGKATLYAGTENGLWKYSRLTGVNEKLNVTENSGSLQILKTKPNPFTTVTEISCNIPLIEGSDIATHYPVRVTLKIFSITGQLVKTLVNTVQTPGRYSMIWNGRDHQHRRVPSGIYWIKLQLRNHSEVRKLIVVK